jgi:D-alanyl-D-alanine carboxypeptidase/D-alanyl-D-alanine-endopeptidase (penicillin-binding protein 4)
MQFLKKMRVPMSVGLLSGIVLFAAQASAQALPASVDNAFRQVGVPAKSVGVFVQEVGSNKHLIASNITSPFNPASVMKLVTTNVALDTLGPAYRWSTYAYVDGPIKDGVLDGNLIIQGGGDPKLVMESFWMFLRQIRAKGVRTIRGNVVIDDKLFTQKQDAAFNFDDEPQKPYNANPNALLVNFKTMAFRFVADEANNSVNVSMEPAMDYPITPPKLVPGDCRDWKGRLRADIRAQGATFNGEFPAGCVEQMLYVHPDTMTSLQYFDKVFRQMWQELNGILLGRAVYGEVGTTAVPIAQWQSPALIDIIRDINKFSNNVMARQLLLTLVANNGNLPADAEFGGAVIKKWFTDKGIDGSAIVVENGSGLSRRERVTPQAMGEMLTAAFQSSLMPEFVSSMPLVGIDGTMRSRLKTASISGQAHIKTGLLEDVRAVAGYVKAASGKYYVVASFVNHKRARDTQAALDALLLWVYENG